MNKLRIPLWLLLAVAVAGLAGDLIAGNYPFVALRVVTLLFCAVALASTRRSPR